MAKKEKIQTLAEQWAAYLYLKKGTELCSPAMDAMRHAAAIRMWEYLHRKSYLGNEMHPGRKTFQGNSFWYIVSWQSLPKSRISFYARVPETAGFYGIKC